MANSKNVFGQEMRKALSSRFQQQPTPYLYVFSLPMLWIPINLRLTLIKIGELHTPISREQEQVIFAFKDCNLICLNFKM